MTDAGPGDRIAAFYERFPYPHRDPDAAVGDLAWIRPGSLPAVAHHVFGGRLPAGRPLRLLVAGGGTGDAVVCLGGWLRRLGLAGRIDYVDLSERSCAIARARAATLGLQDVAFRVAPLESLAEGIDGPYDYIDLCGVLNHVPEPRTALAVLSRVLAPGGGIGVMAYGRIGRTGVYQAQAALALLGVDAGRPDAVALARAFVRGLPQTNWLRRNPAFQALADADDAELADVLLNPRDRAFGVAELDELFAAAGLRIRTFTPPFLYDPVPALRDPTLRAAAAGLDHRTGRQLAELLQGSLKKHVFYAVRDDQGAAAEDEDPAERLLDDPATVLVPAGIRPPALAATLRGRSEQARGIQIDVDGRTISVGLRLSDLGLDVLSAIDGPTRVGAVLDRFAGQRDAARAELRQVQRRLTGLGLLYLLAG
ncbi:hypothetical protein GCM10017083_34230 [Thalassobaculum fulvum]|uniref:Methyltransferase type 12 domain-containing protein n=1 Tax=Thalassobaculum fulvum TaxID=1633335 RepID=A0A919CRV7_9PROT|nr:class I SAM-dependent methyltransferase [Thalassobaculum fulvum]GHD55385.1 hypothetical protein GCM10017083_34230 [Thalassobaculum fulvum]